MPVLDEDVVARKIEAFIAEYHKASSFDEQMSPLSGLALINKYNLEDRLNRLAMIRAMRRAQYLPFVLNEGIMHGTRSNGKI